MASSSYRRSNSNALEQWRYDVFLSFRGKDTRKTFVGHLYRYLVDRGILTFKDDQRLHTGDSIPEKLRAAIEESRIAVVIFSENYAESPWCLDELAHINDCRKEIGQTIIPVFYDVDPCIVRRQKGVYDVAFQQHQTRYGDEKIQRWKEALFEVANLSGLPLSITANGDESECIKKLAQDISSKCTPITSGETNPVGINIRIQKLKSLLRTELNDVRFVGIWGMGGAGKTTLASATYLQMSHEFESKSFVENVREHSKRSGLPFLQQKILSEILLDKTLTVNSLAEGKGLMCSRMNNRKVLIVLDDVDNIEQLEALAASSGWFGKGSRIIITTRDNRLLERPTIKVEIYNTTLLNCAESLQLFSLYAFGKTNPPEDFNAYSSRVVDYANGLPLVLKVLGSTLSGTTKDEWNGALSKLEAAGENKVFESLKISFDGLTEIDQKIFLDIACFFKGDEMDYVTRVIDGLYLQSHFGIKRLIQKSLVWVSEGRVLMHDRIQEMGWHIVRGVSVDHPGKHSRLWHREEICDVFRNNTATNAIEGLSLGSSEELKGFEIEMESFKQMNGLRLLLVHKRVDFLVPRKLDWLLEATKLLPKRLQLTVGPAYLPNSLRWLTWKYYPSRSLPECFGAMNLVGLEMPYSEIVRLWKGRKNLDKLRFLNLQDSNYLKDCPDIGWMPNLQTLYLNDCRGLAMLHPSFAYHEQLVFLSCMGCVRLESLPSSIEMKSLKTLKFSGCESLRWFPDVKNMKRLLELHLDYTDIEELPASIGKLSSLVLLNLRGCWALTSLPSTICGLKCLRTLDLVSCITLSTLPKNLGEMHYLEELLLHGTSIREPPASMVLLKNLKTLSVSKRADFASSMLGRTFCSTSANFCSIKRLLLSNCKLSEEKIPSDLSYLSSLEELDLSHNQLNSLPASICQLPRLKFLDVSKCSKLDAMQALPSSIAMLKADETRTFTSFPDLSINSKSLWKISLCTNYLDHDEPGNSVLESLLQGHLVANHRFSILVLGSIIPKWFSSYSPGNRTHLHQPSNWYNEDLLGFALCASLCLRYYGEYIAIQFDLLEKGTSRHLSTPAPRGRSAGTKVLWLGFMSFDFFRLLFPEYQPCWTTYEGSIGLKFLSRQERACITSCAIRPVYKRDVKMSTPALENLSLVQTDATGRPWLQYKDRTGKVDVMEDACRFTSTRACLRETGYMHARVSFGI